MMTKLGIAQRGAPVLTAPTRPFDLPAEAAEVERILAELERVADEVERCHDFEPTGMGIAAPQIFIGRSVAIFRPLGQPQVVLVNPRIIRCDPADEADWYEDSEGCLSFFDLRCWVPRPRLIVVAHQTLSGAEVTTTFQKDRQARDVMHEVDHLEGRLCLDRMREHGRIEDLTA